MSFTVIKNPLKSFPKRAYLTMLAVYLGGCHHQQQYRVYNNELLPIYKFPVSDRTPLMAYLL